MSDTYSSAPPSPLLSHSSKTFFDHAYFDARQFNKHVNTFQLWGICVGIVICGEYTGWQGGLALGWVNLMVSTILAIIIYACALWTLLDFSTSMPFTSAQFAFSQAAFGSVVGSINAFIVMLSFAQQAATNVAIYARYWVRIFEWPSWTMYVIGIGMYLLIAIINLNSKRFFNVILVFNTYVCLCLLIYLVWAWSKLPSLADWSWLVPSPTASLYRAELSFVKVIDSLPYALWWFIGIEAFPVTVEELVNVPKSAPKAVHYSIATLFFFAITLVWTAPILPPYSSGLGQTDYPIGMSILHGLMDQKSDPGNIEQLNVRRQYLFACLLLFAQGVTPIANIYATSRYMYGLSRAGVLPTCLSLTDKSLVQISKSILLGPSQQNTKPAIKEVVKVTPKSIDKTPVRSVLYAIALAMVCNVILESVYTMWSSSTSDKEAFDLVTDALLRISVWFANVSHAVQLASYIRVRLTIRSLERPCPSPVGVSGAIFALIVVVVFGIVGPFLLRTSIYWFSVLGLVVLCSLLVAYYHKFARRRLTLTPELVFIQQVLHSQDIYSETSFISPTVVIPPVPCVRSEAIMKEDDRDK